MSSSEYGRFEDYTSGPPWVGVEWHGVPWSGARQECSIFPDVDQMLNDIGPVVDERADGFLKQMDRLQREIFSMLGCPRELLDCPQANR